MCRYARPFKTHQACFHCRKTFKRRLLGDIEGSGKESKDAKCPQCGGLTADMGYDFESPRQSDIKAWNHMRRLYTAGVTFYSCGCSGPGYIPANAAALRSLLLCRKKEYVEQMRFWNGWKAPTTKKEREEDGRKNSRYHYNLPFQKRKSMLSATSPLKIIDGAAALAYWKERIALVDARLAHLAAD